MTLPSPLVSVGGRACALANLQQAMEEVFDLMLASRLELSPEWRAAARALEITAMVGLAGRFSAVLTMRCSSKSAVRMASLMLGVDAENAGPDVWDAVGEICNMVAGNFKNKINGLGHDCSLSVPTVITGTGYELQPTAEGDLHLAFGFEGEPIVLSLEVHE